MKEKFRIANLKTGTFKEGSVSKQLRSVISQWVAYAVRHYSDWDMRPNSGYFFSGAYVYEIESSATVMTTASMITFGSYDKEVIGVSKDRLTDMTIRTIRYLCLTHYTGPSDCVRPKSRNPRTSGKKWGYTPGNFFMSSQTGVSVSMLGLAAWLLWDRLDDETKVMVSRVLEFYADEFCKMTPGSGVYNDTQCEENAWTSLGIAAAMYIFPEHPHSSKWRDGYINWSLNSVTTYKDKLKNELCKVSGKSRGGFEHKGKKYGISSVTFHPDFTTENHGYVHPDYMGGGIILRASSIIFPLLVGQEPIGSIFYNMENLYNKVLKPWMGPDGNPIPVQGQDWFYHRHQNKLLMHTALNLFFNDRDAALFEKKCIDIIIKRQKSTGRGCLLEKNGDELEVTPGLQSVSDMEYGAIRTIVLSYLMHLANGDGTVPETDENIMNKLSGNHMYPYGGVYIYRTPRTFASFTTRCSIMGLTMPEDGLWDITSDFQGLTGIIKEKDPDDDFFADKKVNWKDIGIETLRENLEEYGKGFSILAEVPRASGAVLQISSFTALPDGKTVYAEKCKAVADVEIGTYKTGKITIGNENFETIPKRAKGYKDIYFNGEREQFYGNYEGENITVSKTDIKHINMDGKIGYVLHGSCGIEYLNRHKYPKWKGLEDTLILNKREPGFMTAGETTEIFAVVSMPNTTIYEMEKECADVSVTCEKDSLLIMRVGQRRVSVNFSSEKIMAEEETKIKSSLVQIFPGRTSIKENNMKTAYMLNGFTSSVSEACAVLEMEDPANMDIICTDSKATVINKSKANISFKYFAGKAGKNIVMEEGEALELPCGSN